MEKKNILIELFQNTKKPTGLSNHQENTVKILKQNFNILYLVSDFNRSYIKLNIRVFLIYFRFFLQILFGMKTLLLKLDNNFIINFENNSNEKYFYLPLVKKFDKFFSIFNAHLFINCQKYSIALVYNSFLSSLKYQGIKKIITIHDVIDFEKPELTVHENLLLNKIIFKWYKNSIKNTDLIFTVSNTSKKSISKYFNCFDKLRVTYQSYNPFNFENISKISIVDFKLQKNQYYFFNGALEPKKNLELLIDCFLKYDYKYKLVIINNPGWRNNKLQKKINLLRNNKPNSLLILEHLNRDILGLIISNSRALIFPSIIEGFGLPILEALSLKTPCIVSDIPIFNELFTNKVHYINHNDINDLNNAIKKFDDDKFYNTLINSDNFLNMDLSLYSEENYKKKILYFFNELFDK